MTPNTGLPMKIVFKSEDFAELNYTREYTDGFEVDGTAQIRETIAETNYKGIRSQVHRIYCPGIIFSTKTGSLEQNLVQILESDFPYLQMHFELTTTGCLYFPMARFEIETEIYGGTHSLLFYPSLNGKLNYLKKAESTSVEIELSLDFIRRIFNYDLEVLNEFGRNIEKNYPAIMGSRSFPITSCMKHILSQVQNCKYTGILKRLFVEAKVIELLTLQISQINGFQTNKKVLKKIDIDKLNDIKDLLIKNLYNPYSIEELSKIAGINRTKLQEGFKELFGTTIFSYITDNRLEEARQKIQDETQTTSIAEIAALSGYKNPQHFTAAFKRKFGFLPKDRLRNTR
jgi:AraC family transcriptional activator of pyochelin receptor